MRKLYIRYLLTANTPEAALSKYIYIYIYIGIYSWATPPARGSPTTTATMRVDDMDMSTSEVKMQFRTIERQSPAAASASRDRSTPAGQLASPSQVPPAASQLSSAAHQSCTNRLVAVSASSIYRLHANSPPPIWCLLGRYHYHYLLLLGGTTFSYTNTPGFHTTLPLHILAARNHPPLPIPLAFRREVTYTHTNCPRRIRVVNTSQSRAAATDKPCRKSSSSRRSRSAQQLAAGQDRHHLRARKMWPTRLAMPSRKARAPTDILL